MKRTSSEASSNVEESSPILDLPAREESPSILDFPVHFVPSDPAADRGTFRTFTSFFAFGAVVSPHNLIVRRQRKVQQQNDNLVSECSCRVRFFLTFFGSSAYATAIQNNYYSPLGPPLPRKGSPFQLSNVPATVQKGSR